MAKNRPKIVPKIASILLKNPPSTTPKCLLFCSKSTLHNPQKIALYVLIYGKNGLVSRPNNSVKLIICDHIFSVFDEKMHLCGVKSPYHPSNT